MLYAMQAAGQHSIAHGDLKCENVLVSTSLTVYITDFASCIKPTYLPLDDPADFSLFFDTSDRRTCYLAPERFYEGKGASTAARAPAARRPESSSAARQAPEVDNVTDLLAQQPYWETFDRHRPNGPVTEAMDVFALGCVLAELWRDGAPLFTLSHLFRYRSGQFPVQAMLDEISDEGMRSMIASMIQVDPAARPTFAALLSDGTDTVFPSCYAHFLHMYLVDLQRGKPEATHGASLTASARLERVLLPDERIETLYEDWGRILPYLGELREVQQGPGMDLGICLTGASLSDPAPRRARLAEDGPGLLVLSALLANVRSAQRASTRCHALEMMMHLAYGWLTDEACLNRVVPYMVALLHDDSVAVRGTALLYVVAVLSLVESTTPGNTGLFCEYILPHLQPMAQDASVHVRTVYATYLAPCIQAAMRFAAWEQIPGQGEGPMSAGYEEQMGQLRHDAQAQLLLLLADDEPSVRRATLQHWAPVCTLLGPERVETYVMSHLLTYFNHTDWELRAAVFPAVESLLPIVGGQPVEQSIKPLLVQALGDTEENVVLASVRSLARMVAAEAFLTDMRYDVLWHTAGFLVHPNLWIREAAVGLFAEAAAHGEPAEAWTMVYALARPMLRCDVEAMDAESLYTNLATPLPRGIMTAAIAAIIHRHTTFVAFWQKRVEEAWHASRDPHTLIHASLDCIVRPPDATSRVSFQPSNQDERAMLARLEVGGFAANRDGPKVLALWWYFARLAAAHPSAAQAAPSKSLAHALPSTVFFTPTAESKAPLSLDEAASASIPSSSTRSGTNRAAGLAKQYVARANEHATHTPAHTDTPAATARAPRAMQPGLLRQPLFHTAPTKAQASVSLAYAHAEQAKARAGENAHDVSTHPRAPTSEYTHTYEGHDPYILAHLETVYERLVGGGASSGKAPLADDGSKHGRLHGPNNPRPEGKLVACFTEHADAITALQPASDQRFFVSGAEDGWVKVWDTARLERNVTSRSRVSYGGHGAPITALVVLEGTYTVVSAARDGSIHAYAINVTKTSSLPQYSRPDIHGRTTLRHHEHVLCITPWPSAGEGQLLMGTSQGRILVWDVHTMKPQQVMTAPAWYGGLSTLVVDRDNHWACTGSTNGILSLWDLRFFLLLGSWSVGDSDKARMASVSALSLHPTLSRCVLVSYSTDVEAPLFDVFDLDGNRVVATYTVAGDGQPLPPSRSHYRTVPSGPDAPLSSLLPKKHGTAHVLRPPVVDTLLADVRGYSSSASGAHPDGYVLAGGDPAMIRFVDLGSVRESLALGSTVTGEFLYVFPTYPAASTAHPLRLHTIRTRCTRRLRCPPSRTRRCMRWTQRLRLLRLCKRTKIRSRRLRSSSRPFAASPRATAKARSVCGNSTSSIQSRIH